MSYSIVDLIIKIAIGIFIIILIILILDYLAHADLEPNEQIILYDEDTESYYILSLNHNSTLNNIYQVQDDKLLKIIPGSQAFEAFKSTK